MKETGILMKPDLAVKAERGEKSQTRRVMKSQPRFADENTRAVSDGTGGFVFWDGIGSTEKLEEFTRKEYANKGFRCPFGKPGDCLYLKEPHWRWGHWERRQVRKGEPERWRFVAGDETVHPALFEAPNETPADRTHLGYHKRSPLFMPKAIARRWFEVTDVRVQRVHEITPEDCMAEGIGYLYNYNKQDIPADARRRFAELWNSINGRQPGCAWDDNPWVWAITFRRIDHED